MTMRPSPQHGNHNSPFALVPDTQHQIDSLPRLQATNENLAPSAQHGNQNNTPVVVPDMQQFLSDIQANRDLRATREGFNRQE